MATAQVSTDFEPDSPTLYPQATGSSGTLAVKIMLSPQLHGRRTDSHGDTKDTLRTCHIAFAVMDQTPEHSNRHQVLGTLLPPASKCCSFQREIAWF